MRAMLPVSDKCWEKWLNKNESAYCDVDNYGFAKKPHLVKDFITRGHCGCEDEAIGQYGGYSCYSSCDQNPSIQNATALKCGRDRICRVKSDTSLYCGCISGYILNKDENGKTHCIKPGNACETCKYHCHVSSGCQSNSNSKDGYTCQKCNPALGYEERKSNTVSPGTECIQINECQRGTHKCESNAQCVDKTPLLHKMHFKYECICKDGWRGSNNSLGTECSRCHDENECDRPVSPCPANSDCMNSPGSFTCTCKNGYEEITHSNGTKGCVNKNECLRSPCGKFADCKDTPGSYECVCWDKYRPTAESIMPNVDCELDPDQWCNDCDRNSTICKIHENGHSMHCVCKKGYEKVSETLCKPYTFCDKPNNCFPEKSECSEMFPPGVNYTCKCKTGYQGDGYNCSSTDYCERERPCANVANTICVTEGASGSCQCKNGYTRQIDQINNFTAPCFDFEHIAISNCSRCDYKLQTCEKVSNKTEHVKACICKYGYFMSIEQSSDGEGICINENECARGTHNCDRALANCIDHHPAQHPEGKRFECRCKTGFEGDGTVGQCRDIVECLNSTFYCPGHNQTCVNTIGSYECKCLNGYEMIPGINSCKDFDECKLDPCGINSKCINTIGSYKCECEKGYTPTNKTTANGHVICRDIDECKEPTLANIVGDACNKTTSICRNFNGSYACDCLPGFINDRGCCVDIDECATNRANCDKTSTTCLNTLGSFSCVCLSGYKPSTESHYCIDINECLPNEVKNHTCKPNTVCKNDFPHYHCECAPNYELAPNQFNTRKPTCVRKKICNDAPGICGCGSCVDTDKEPFYRCLCPPGSYQANDTVCLTQKYCDDQKYICPNGKCVNNECQCDTMFKWTSFPPPYNANTLDKRPGCERESLCETIGCPSKMMICIDTIEFPHKNCSCPLGFIEDVDTHDCIDRNECEESNTCPANSDCVNTYGSHFCKCLNGFVNVNPADSKNPKCENINECSLNLHNCTKIPHSYCNDTVPGFECVCKSGFDYLRDDGRRCNKHEPCPSIECKNIDECKLYPDICGPNSNCTDTPGFYHCDCLKGFRMNEKRYCEPIPYCDENLDNCNRTAQDCIQLIGFFNCSCKPGFEAQGTDCVPINECLIPKLNNCTEQNKTCVDLPYGFFCRCPEGFFENSKGKCESINVCSTMPCLQDQKCINKNPGHSCECPKGFKKDPLCEKIDYNNCKCIDIPECKEPKICGKNMECHELPGSYRCECVKNFVLDKDGKNCEEPKVCENPTACKETETCIPTAPGEFKCECDKPTSYLYNGTCYKNPCSTHKCADKTATHYVNATFLPPTCACICPTGFEMQNDKCVPSNICGCTDKSSACSNSTYCPVKEMFCEPRYGADPKCTCPPGYMYDEKKKECVDINECPKGCPTEANCTNTVGSYTCTCKTGLIYKDGSCITDIICTTSNNCNHDINAECRVVGNKGVCACKEGWIGTGQPGDPPCHKPDHCFPVNKCNPLSEIPVNNQITETCDCVCKRNFTKTINEKGVTECTDVNECLTEPCKPHLPKICNDLPDGRGYECICPPNTMVENKDGTCDFIDLCLNVTCPSNSICESRTGQCICIEGFRSSWNNGVHSCVDNDECKLGTHNCTKYETCENLVPGFTCICNLPFFYVNPKTNVCEDVDECPAECDLTTSECVNEIGGWHCKCKPPYVSNGKVQCVKNETTGCECDDVNAHCMRTGDAKFTYNCTCNFGFRKDETGKCININECLEKTHNCHKNATCEDKTPGFSCTCIPPLEGNGVNYCNFPDVCAVDSKYNDCPVNSDCIPLDKFVNTSAGAKLVDCRCHHKGFKFDPNTRKCIDINECLLNPCPKEAFNCTNLEGSFTCFCPDGFTYKEDTNECANIDECTLGKYDKQKCPSDRGTCRDLPGTWDCVCLDNHEHSDVPVNQTCIRKKWCETPQDDCDKATTTCEELATGGFHCPCIKGFIHVPNTNNKKCEDKNECVVGEHNCTENELCTNLIGSFYCNCTNGFTKDKHNICAPAQNCVKECGPYGFAKLKPDNSCTCHCMNRYIWNATVNGCIPVSICEAQAHTCPLNSHCFLDQAQNGTNEKTVGFCKCNKGYYMEKYQCHQENICKDQPDICGVNGTCQANPITPQEYNCLCANGTVIMGGVNKPYCGIPTCENDTTCDASAKCVVSNGAKFCDCPPGFQGVGIKNKPCTKIDVCGEYNPCSKFATCKESMTEPGVPTCECNLGYTGNGTYCIDVDECDPKKPLHACDGNATCFNTQGSYKCNCNTGYIGNGLKCVDNNECEKKEDKCDHMTTYCNNTAGSYECPCLPGYEPKENDRFSCKNINECLNLTICGTTPLKQNHKCIDLPGTYECECLLGYKNAPGNKKVCIDNDECLEGGICPINSDCNNTIGSYECHCHKGFKKDDKGQCILIDICKEGKDNCDRKTTTCFMFVDKPAFRCDCLPGFQPNSADPLTVKSCDDINECDLHKAELSKPGVKCNNTVGSFTTACAEGYRQVNGTSGLNIECENVNECAEDAAYGEALKIIEILKANSTEMSIVMAALPKPKDPKSAYAICYNMKLDNIKFLERLPVCIDKDPSYVDNGDVSVQLMNLKGFTCGCPDGSAPFTENIDSGIYQCQQRSCSCPGENFDSVCVQGARGSCKCKAGFNLRRKKDAAGLLKLICTQEECDEDTDFAELGHSGASCVNGVIQAPEGFRIGRDNVTQEIMKFEDINECEEYTSPCGCPHKAGLCTTGSCVICNNLWGSYECYINRTDGPKLKCAQLDNKTCACGEAICNTVQSWFYDCIGCNVTQRSFAESGPVCSRILNDEITGFVTYPSAKALLEHGCALYKRGMDGECSMNVTASPDSLFDHPLFNYKGACVASSATPICENGVKASRASRIGRFNLDLGICIYDVAFDNNKMPAGSTSSSQKGSCQLTGKHAFLEDRKISEFTEANVVLK